MHTARGRSLVFVLIVLAYLAIGAAYSILTPEWQVPDEPAHYNYIRQVAAGNLPEIKVGDYDQEYLEWLKTEGFPADQAVDSIQYEDHQPPLYYLLAAPVFCLFGGALIPLRLFSVLLGAGVILVTGLITRRLYPSRPTVQFMAVSVAAFIPQHIAMMAGVNNDSLAELLVATALLSAVLVIDAEKPPHPCLLGLLVGAAFVTKIQAYIVAPTLMLAGLIRWRRDTGKGWRWFVGWVLCVFGPALLIGGMWWVRNLITYGGLDWMGLDRHNIVVVGQPTTAGWIADHGIAATLTRFFQFTFQSFWGMFGWMAVPMSARAYQVVGAWSAATACGLFDEALASGRWSRYRKVWMMQRPGWPALLLTTSALLTFSGYIWWNLGYVQHQGRYLYPALVPIAVAAGVAWNRLTQKVTARLTGTLLLIVALVAAFSGNRWAAVVWTSMSGLLWLGSIQGSRKRWLMPAAAATALAILSGASLYLYVLAWLN